MRSRRPSRRQSSWAELCSACSSAVIRSTGLRGPPLQCDAMAVNPQGFREDAADHPRYRTWVGPPHKYDRIGAMQFNLLTTIGLREHHSLLDIGCGSLRGGRLFIPYLLPDRYFGLDPYGWLVRTAIERELGTSILEIKRPVFLFDENFSCSAFGRNFDFLIAHSVFSHASQRQILRCLTEVKSCLAKTSIFAATYLPGEVNYEGDGWLYPD